MLLSVKFTLHNVKYQDFDYDSAFVIYVVHSSIGIQIVKRRNYGLLVPLGRLKILTF